MSDQKLKKGSVFNKKYLPWLVFGLIILVAVFFRFWRLNSLPPGLHPDEAANGLDVFRILENHDIRVLYNTNGPREALFFYLQAIFVFFMGNTILALRIAPAIIGVLAVVAIYFWGNEWFGRRVGLLAAGIAAINPWAITVTRDGFRASMVPLMVALVMIFGAKALKTSKRVWFILAGLCFGLGFYTYTAFSMLSVAVLCCGVYLLIVRRKWLKDNLVNIVVALVTFFVIISPLVYLTVRHPEESTSRAGGTSFLNKNNNNGKPLQTLFESTAKTLLQFNWRGDDNSRHNTPQLPLLNTFIGIMFLIGVAICILHLNRPKYFALLGVFGAMLLPGILTVEGVPHALRTIGSSSAAFILAALGINYIIFNWYKTFPINNPARIVGASLIALLLLLSGLQAYKQYFVAWAQNPATYEAYAEDAVEMAKFLNGNCASDRKNYVYSGDYTLITTSYLTHKKCDYTRLNKDELLNLPIENGKKLFVINKGNREDNLFAIDTIAAKFADGNIVEHKSPFNDKLLFYTYEVN